MRLVLGRGLARTGHSAERSSGGPLAGRRRSTHRVLLFLRYAIRASLDQARDEPLDGIRLRNVLRSDGAAARRHRPWWRPRDAGARG